MKKLITFSLWGNDPKYCVGAIRNAHLALKIYPGWTCRFYIPSSLSCEETQPGLFMGGELAKTMDVLLGIENTQVILMDEPADWRGMFWRFLPAGEDDVDVFISRDCDSRLCSREADVVKEWMSSPQLMHAMRDHPEHSVPILGGMWGAKKHAVPNMKELIDKWNKEDRWQTDQEFLRSVIWPQCYHKFLVHDDWNRFPMAKNMPFMDRRIDSDFIGSIIGPNEERLHPEHHAILK